MDAVTPLQARRMSAAAALETRDVVQGARVVARGSRIETWLRSESPSWSELRSIRVSAAEPDLAISLPHNRSCVARGLRMVSVFDYGGVTPGGRELLASEVDGLYLFAYAPLQMKVVNMRTVLLQGPFREDEPTVMALTDPATIEAAVRYWRAVIGTAVPCRPMRAAPPGLSPRQHQVLALLGQDLSDERVASVLGVSIRTVRSDVARALRTLGVGSRFAAGVEYAALSTRSVMPER